MNKNNLSRGMVVLLALCAVIAGVLLWGTIYRADAAADAVPNGAAGVSTPTAATGGLRDVALTETCDLLEQEGRLFAYCESVAGELVPFAPQESVE